MEKVMDYSERLFIVALAALFFTALLRDFPAHPYVVLLALSEGLPVALMMIRKPGEISHRAYPFFLALAGTSAPLLVRPVQGGLSVVPLALAVTVMGVGLMLNIAAKFALCRSFGLAPANRGIRCGGPYRLVRHPMYLGYIVTQVGFLLANLTVGNLVKYLITWSLQLLRIREEEKFLLEDGAYRELARRVRFRLIPGLY